MTVPARTDDTQAQADLKGSLLGGVLPSVRAERPAALADQDRKLLTNGRLQEVFASLYQVRLSGSAPERGTIIAALDRLAGELASDRDLLIAVLMSPDTAMEVCDQLTGRRPRDLADRWLALCWLAESAWQVIADPAARQQAPDPNPNPDPPATSRSPSLQAVSAEDRRLLYPLAARIRFLVLSEPFRERGQPQHGSLRTSSRASPVQRLYGSESWHVLVDRARQARATWLICLDAYQSHPYLAAAPAEKLERELSLLVFSRGRGSAPLGLTGRDLHQPAVLGAGDITLIGDVIERHLLPRFDLASVTALGWRAHRNSAASRSTSLRRGHTILVAAAMLAVTPVALLTSLWWAAGLAAVAYTLLGLGVVGFGGPWTAPWMLRLPAAASVGLLVLLTLPENWWQSARPGWSVAVLAPVVLAAAAFGYLVLEACNHGIARSAVLGRALAVTALGTVHALLVALIGMVAVAPAFTAHGHELGRLLTGAGAGDGRHLILLGMATAWCLSVGVFSQILWDDRPISAPLAHTNWRAAP